jgi:tetratricopeptide (TPR) repeat protein
MCKVGVMQNSEKSNLATNEVFKAYEFLRAGQLNSAEHAFKVVLTDPKDNQGGQPIIDGVALCGLSTLYIKNQDEQNLAVTEAAILELWADKSDDCASMNMVKGLSKISKFRRFEGNHERAKQLILVALQIARVNGLVVNDEDLLGVYTELGALCSSLRHYKRASAVFFHCLSILEISGKQKSLDALPVLNNLACVLAFQNSSDSRAEQLWQECINICKENNTYFHEYLQAVASLCRFQLGQNKINEEQAIEMLEDSVSRAEDSCEGSTRIILNPLVELAVICINRDAKEKAGFVCEKIVDLLRTNRSGFKLDDPGKTPSLYIIGRYLMEQKNYESAKITLEYTKNLAQKNRWMSDEVRGRINSTYADCLRNS